MVMTVTANHNTAKNFNCHDVQYEPTPRGVSLRQHVYCPFITLTAFPLFFDSSLQASMFALKD